MNVTPKSEEEVTQFKTWDDGVYSFEILEKVKFGSKEYRTCETQSSKGAEMLVLVVNVFNDNGQTQTIIDYMVEEFAAKKIRHVAVACGLLSQYEAGVLNADDFIGKSGKVRLYTQKGKAKDDGSGFWSDKNAIGDYVIDDEDQSQDTAHIAASVGKIVDDSIPFAKHQGSL